MRDGLSGRAALRSIEGTRLARIHVSYSCQAFSPVRCVVYRGKPGSPVYPPTSPPSCLRYQPVSWRNGSSCPSRMGSIADRVKPPVVYRGKPYRAGLSGLPLPPRRALAVYGQPVVYRGKPPAGALMCRPAARKEGLPCSGVRSIDASPLLGDCRMQRNHYYASSTMAHPTMAALRPRLAGLPR